MKVNRILYLLITILLFFSCEKSNKKVDFNGYSINGIVSINKEKIIYLLNNENSIIDSATIVKKHFHLKGNVSKPSNYYFKFKNSDEKHPILLENESFIVAIDKDKSIVYGGNLNDKYRNYKNRLRNLEDNKTPFLNENKEKLTLDFINQNTNNILSNIVLNESKNLQLKDLLQIQEKIENTENSSFKTVLNSKIDELQKIAEENLAKEKAALALKKAYRKPAILFSGDGLNNENVSLESIIKGKKAVLIDFWASWCGPCRIMTPSIRELFNKYKDKGFTILTVSEDKDKASWKKGITEDKMLSWNHIYDDYSRISNMHGIKAIPYMILIDGKGRVIKENITYTQLSRALKKICK